MIERVFRHLRTKTGLCIAAVLLITIAGFFVVHSNMPNAPGANPKYPLGWWGAFDQGHYFNSATAFREGDLTPERHFYPPLYSYLASVFYAAGNLDPFKFFNLGLLIAYCGIFLAFAKRFVGIGVSSIVLLAGIGLYGIIRSLWVMPWTSTLAAPLMAAAFLLLARFLEFDGKQNRRHLILNALGFGFFVGLLVPTRPIDLSVVLLPSLVYAVITVHRIYAGQSRERVSYLLSAGAGTAGALIPVIGYLYFNYSVFGEFSSQYMSNTESKGFFPFDIPDQLYSHLYSSQSFYGENNADWFSQIPIIFFVLLAAVLAVFSKVPLILKIVTGSFLLQIALYYGFSDIIPTGTFRYQNIHYFKWGFPFLFLVSAFLIQHFLATPSNLSARPTIAFGALALLAVSLETSPKPVSFTAELGSSDNYILKFDEAKPVDFIDISNVRGTWPEVYFGFSGTIKVDDVSLRPIKNYRLFPIENGVRLMFVRPVRPSKIEVILPPILNTACFSETEFHPGHVTYGLGLPFEQQFDDGLLQPMTPHPPIRADNYDFSIGGNSDPHVDSNWSAAEKHWRWMEGDTASLHFDVSGFEGKNLRVKISAVAFDPTIDNPVISTVFSSGQELGKIEFVENGKKGFSFDVPSDLVSSEGVLSLDLLSRDPKKPEGKDYRLLSIGIVSLQIATACS